ncbi:unnamed protein product, partial [Prunus brigantina]
NQGNGQSPRTLVHNSKLWRYTVAKVMVDGGAAINLLPHGMLSKMGRTRERFDSYTFDCHQLCFGGITKTHGILDVDVVVGSKKLKTAFFVVDTTSTTYNALLGRDWIHQNLFLKRKTGAVRICVDYRNLNDASPKDEYPMPMADMLVDGAAHNQMLSFMDGNAGYNQIMMAEEDIHKTAFMCPGHIGATYQRAMNSVFHDMI